MIRTREFFQFILLCYGVNFLLNSNLQAQQNLIVANPANTLDAKSAFVNPAILHFRVSQFIVGMKVFHVGFLENDKLGFRNNYFSFSTPYLMRENLVFGITGQHFSVPLYNKSYFSFILSHKLRHQFTIGLKYNILTQGYDQNKFDLVKPIDPVFKNDTRKFSQSLGIGILFFPRSDLSIGFSWNHINKPDISLMGDGIHQPHWFDLGLRYSYKLLSTSFSINRFENSNNFSWMFELIFTEHDFIRFGYEMNSAKIEGQVYLVKGFSLNYSYDYPLCDLNQISSGSHQINVIYDFDYEHRRIMKHKKIDIVEHNKQTEKKFFVRISTDQLEIINKKLKRVVDAEITQDHLHNLTTLEVGILDSSKSDKHFYDPNYVYKTCPNKQVINSKLLYQYRSYLKMLSDQLEQDKNKRVVIFSDNQNDIRVKQLKKYFPKPLLKQIVIKPIAAKSKLNSFTSIIQNEQKLTLLFPQKVHFEIIGTRENYDQYWKLEISDYRGKTVQTFENTGKIPPQIDWDWRDKNGNLLQADDYYYTFYWTDLDGNLTKGERRKFKVKKIIRHLDVEITKKPKANFDTATELFKIKLHN